MNAAPRHVLAAIRLGCVAQAVAWATAAVVSFVCWRSGFDGVVWGGAIMATNLQLMRTLVGLALDRGRPSEGPNVPLLSALIGAKFVALLALTAAVALLIDPSPLGLLLGFATLLVGVVAAAFALGGASAKGTT